MQNRQPHLHCTRCFKWDKCTDPSCRKQRMHPGQFCSHGFQVFHEGPNCPVHCAWECITQFLMGRVVGERKWAVRDAQCMANIVLNQRIGLSQHADMPPKSPLETPEEVLRHVQQSAECSKALAAAVAFMAHPRSTSDSATPAQECESAMCTQATSAAATLSSSSTSAAARVPLSHTPCRNWAKTGSCPRGGKCSFSHE